MTINRKIVQLSLLTIGISLIILTYFFYPKIKTSKLYENTIQEEMSKNNLETDVKNKFENVSYKGENSGNPFTISAAKAEIRENANIIHMKRMIITISLTDRDWIIECEAGRYNKSNYDIFCSENVKATDDKTIVYSKNLDLLADESARIYNDVIILNEENSNLYADSVYYDFENRVYTVNMFSDNESVKIKLIKWVTSKKNLGS